MPERRISGDRRENDDGDPAPVYSIASRYLPYYTVRMQQPGRIRLIIIISIVLVVAFVSVSIFNYNTAKNSINEEIRSSSLPLLRENIYSEIKNDFIPAINIASMMATDSFLRNWAIEGEKNKEEILQYLKEIHNAYGYFSTFFVSSVSGNYYHHSRILKQISPEDDHDGIIQAHSDNTKIESVSITKKAGIESIADELLSGTEEPVDGVYEEGRHRILITSRYIPEMDWFLFVEQNESAALAPVRKNLWRTILIGFGTSVVIILISALTINFYQKRLERLAITDELTGAANRRELERQFTMDASRFERYKAPLCFIMADVDHFKLINDTRGHNQGDGILVNIVRIIRENIRPDDIIARWGGDEFVIMLESTTEEASALAVRLAKSLKEGQFPCTLSIGIADYRGGESLEQVIERADSAMYESKMKGRDSPTVYNEPAEHP